MLSKEEIERYQRQVQIFQEKGQEDIKNTRVFLAGAGGLGSPIAIYLAVAGIGKIRIIDHDFVGLSNLNRQILYGESDLGREKATCAQEKLKELNPHVDVETMSTTIDENNIDELIKGFDVIIDAMDNFSTRYLLNKAAVRNNLPLFHGAVSGFYGQATTIIPNKTACLKCIFPKAPLPETFPVVDVTCAVIGCIQVTEVLKYILKMGTSLENILLMWDGLNSMIEKIVVGKNPLCGVCSK